MSPIVPCTPAPSEAQRRAEFHAAMAACRAGTAPLFEDLSEDEYRAQAHPGYSPLGWHLGHIAYTEALWLVKTCGGDAMPRPELERVYHVDALDKPRRPDALPPTSEAWDYVAEVRRAVFGVLERAPIGIQERYWRFVLQHESQHSETVAVIKALWRQQRGDPAGTAPAAPPPELVRVPGGPALRGSDSLDALDNEHRPHRVDVADFSIGRYPVTQAEYAAFIAAGGYDEPRWWSRAGWAWRRREGVDGPLHWRDGAPDHPVCGVSAYEAEAFCAFHGLRLPTEAEWEKAAAWDPAAARTRPFPWGDGVGGGWAPCAWDRMTEGTAPVGHYPGGASAYGVHDMLGNVWEWTASVFAPYDGFVPWPYDGYSTPYFDGAHRVLRGGSWATRPWAIRTSFRNWYTPGTRQLFAGFRVARDGCAAA